jgi:uncharacterized protein
MKRKGFLLVAVFLFLFALVGCNRGEMQSSVSQKQSSSDGKLVINFGTGTTTGVYYPLGATLAKIWNQQVPGVKVSSQATDASVQNLNLMMQGKLNMGITTFGVLHDAYTGKGAFKGRAYKDVRVLAALYPNIGHIVTRQGDIHSVADLKNKGFVPGAPGSSTKVVAGQILSAYKMTFDDVKAQYVGFTEVTDLMRNKQIDGAFIEAGVPNSAVVEILTTANGKLLSIGDKEIQFITKHYPGFYKYTIPAGTYEGQAQDVHTIAEGNLIVVPKDLPQEKVYELTKTLWENVDTITKNISAAKEMKLETATKGLSNIPLHKGAEKYYKEKGILH